MIENSKSPTYLLIYFILVTLKALKMFGRSNSNFKAFFSADTDLNFRVCWVSMSSIFTVLCVSKTSEKLTQISRSQFFREFRQIKAQQKFARDLKADRISSFTSKKDQFYLKIFFAETQNF